MWRRPGVPAIENRDGRVRIQGHVGDLAEVASIHVALIAGLRLVLACTASAPGPTRFGRAGGVGRIVSIAVECQDRATNGYNIWREGRIIPGRAVLAKRRSVASRSEERDGGVAARGSKDAVVSQFASILPATETHGNNGNSRIVRRKANGRRVICIARRLNKQDVRTGSQGMRPFDVRRFFQFPTVWVRAGLRIHWTSGVCWGQILRAVLRNDRKVRRVGQTKRLVENVQITLNIRIVVNIDNGDRLAAPVTKYRPELYLVVAVGMPDLRWHQVGRRRGRIA